MLNVYIYSFNGTPQTAAPHCIQIKEAHDVFKKKCCCSWPLKELISHCNIQAYDNWISEKARCYSIDYYHNQWPHLQQPKTSKHMSFINYQLSSEDSLEERKKNHNCSFYQFHYFSHNLCQQNQNAFLSWMRKQWVLGQAIDVLSWIRSKWVLWLRVNRRLYGFKAINHKRRSIPKHL